jgi:hypothetical protein
MRAWPWLAACVAFGLAGGQAFADNRPPDLRVRGAGAGMGLRMRQAAPEGPGAAQGPAAAAQAAPAEDPAGAGGAAAPGAPEVPGAPERAGGSSDDSRDGSRRDRRRAGQAMPPGSRLDDQVVFRFNLGFGLDGATTSSRRSLDGSTCLLNPRCRSDYARNRVYGFGDVVLGRRGLLAQSLAGYFAAQFRFDQHDFAFAAVPTVYDGEGVQEVQVRSAYGEMDRMFETSWLRPLYVRIGRQYRHGAAVAHFDGLTLSYDTRVGSIGLFLGAGVDLYGVDAEPALEGDGFLSGVTARLDLAALGRGPIVLTANTLDYDGREHADLAAAVRIRRDIDARVRLRRLDEDLAQADVQVRARLSAVTIAVLDLAHSTASDWRYDPLLVAPAREYALALDSRRYLNLEPPGPQTYLSLRAGTVLLDNVDLLVRGVAAVEHEDEGARDPAAPARFASNYFEGGAAMEVRLQRTLSLMLSGMARWRPARVSSSPAIPGNSTPDELPEDPGYARDDSYYEGGAVARYTEGARAFSAEAEVYLRHYERFLLYEVPGLPDRDDRVGGRLSVEGWAGERLRLRLEYDATSVLASVPELGGFKSLRLMLEGRF